MLYKIGVVLGVIMVLPAVPAMPFLKNPHPLTLAGLGIGGWAVVLTYYVAFTAFTL